MTATTRLTDADRELVRRFEEAGQGHVFRYLEELPWTAQGALLEQARAIDLVHLSMLATDSATESGAAEIDPPGDELVTWDAGADARASARSTGIAEIEARRVAVVVAAGGQGTRLGSPAPKGMWPVGPASGKALLQWHAEKVLYWARRIGRPIPFIVMLSEATRRDTEEFLRWHGHFGLDPTSVKTMCQPSLPPLDGHGKLILAAKDRIAASPNGHGCTYATLRDAKLLDLLEDLGVTTISYVQVDNPLVQALDPAFIGLHVSRRSQISSKSVRKTGPGEKVGVFARVDGRSAIVEYSELSDEQARETSADGALTYGQGSIAAHCLDRAFCREMADRGLPLHLARKKVPYIDASGALEEPETANANKFESFLFDAIPLADRSLVMETQRALEFSPLKNAFGAPADTPTTVREHLIAQFRGWYERAGMELPEGAIEVAPFDAPDEIAFRELHGLAPLE